MKTVSIFHVPVTDCTVQETTHIVHSAIYDHRPTWIVTINPELLLYARRHASYAEVLQHASVRIPDGIGLRFVSRIRHVVPGVEIAEHILNQAEQGRLRVVCVVRADGLSTLNAVLDALHRRAPHAQCRGVALSLNQLTHAGIVKTISEFQPNIILVGLGFPYQEEWLHRYFSSIRSAAIGIGIGGTFDYWTGVVQRAPLWMRRIGCEWLWRLLHQPQRIGRIFDAVIVFPLMVFKDRMRHLYHPKR